MLYVFYITTTPYLNVNRNDFYYTAITLTAGSRWQSFLPITLLTFEQQCTHLQETGIPSFKEGRKGRNNNWHHSTSNGIAGLCPSNQRPCQPDTSMAGEQQLWFECHCWSKHHPWRTSHHTPRQTKQCFIDQFQSGHSSVERKKWNRDVNVLRPKQLKFFKSHSRSRIGISC